MAHVKPSTAKSSMITGKSTHNQRIERLWRDMFQGCASLFYNLFYDMERCGSLDPNDDSHLWCLHLVFLPLVNRHLSSWQEAWGAAPSTLRKEQNSNAVMDRGAACYFWNRFNCSKGSNSGMSPSLCKR